MQILGDRTSAGLLVLRAVTGLVFVVHGAQKVFVVGLAGEIASLVRLGIPLASAAAPVVMIVELLGGLMLIAGFYLRPAAALIAIDMVVATFAVHFRHGFFTVNHGYEYTLTLVAVNVALALLGAGGFSVDAWLAGRGKVPRSPAGMPS